MPDPQPHEQAATLDVLAEAIAGSGDLDRAEALARAMTDPQQQASALAELARAVAGSGDLDRAEALARAITDPIRQTAALAELDRELDAPPKPTARKKNLYIAAADTNVWDKAARLAGDSLSSLITELLGAFVAGREAELQGWERIVVPVTSRATESPRKAFFGRWIIRPDERRSAPPVQLTRLPYRSVPLDGKPPSFWAVAQTRKGRIAVWTWTELPGDENKSTLAAAFLLDYDDLDRAVMDELPFTVARLAASRLGQPEVEELDI
jgi:hypothetical protein